MPGRNRSHGGIGPSLWTKDRPKRSGNGSEACHAELQRLISNGRVGVFGRLGRGAPLIDAGGFDVRRYQPCAPHLRGQRIPGDRCRRTCHYRPCERPTRQGKTHQARDQQVVRAIEAGRRRRVERRLRRSRPDNRARGHSPSRLALRHSQLCRRGPASCIGRLPSPRAVSARVRRDALPRERDVSQWPALGGRGRHRRLHGCAQDREGDARRIRLGRAHGQHRRGALAGALQGHGVRERLPDRQPGSRQDAVAPGSGAPMVVSILFRHGARPHRLRQVPARLCEAHLAARFPEVEVRRCHVRSQCRVLRQSGSRQHRDPQLPVAACARRRRIEVRRARQEACRVPGHHGSHDYARGRRQWRAACRTPLRMRRSFRASILTASSRAGSDTTCRRKRQRRSPRR